MKRAIPSTVSFLFLMGAAALACGGLPDISLLATEPPPPRAPDTSPPTQPPPATPEDQGVPEGGVATASTGVIVPVMPDDPSQTSLASYPDHPLDALPSTPISVSYLIEHRTALNGRVVDVRGVVVATLLGERACPSNAGMCAQPSVFLADTNAGNRDLNLDVRVLVGEEEVEAEYPIGATIEIRAQVSSSQSAVVLRKVY